jgi:3-deoxy-D-manno-octulosonic-acid transferase
VARRSQWAQGSTPPEADIWLGDSMGEMALYFGMAHAALLGGSFAPLGGQNLIEAAACGCPVFMGPHTFNFAEASELAEVAGAAFRHTDLASAAMAAARLASDVELREATSQVALAWGAAHRGAARRTAVAVAALLAKAAAPVGPRA